MPGGSLPAEHAALKVPHMHRRELDAEELLLASRDGAAAGLNTEQRGGTAGVQGPAQGGGGVLQRLVRLAPTAAGLERHRGATSGGEGIPCGKEEVIAWHRSGENTLLPATLPPAAGGHMGAGMHLEQLMPSAFSRRTPSEEQGERSVCFLLLCYCLLDRNP